MEIGIYTFAELRRDPAWRRREAARRAGHDPAALPLGINSHGYIADMSEKAADEFFPSYAAMMNAIGRERGWSGITRRDFEIAAPPSAAHSSSAALRKRRQEFCSSTKSSDTGAS